MFDIIVNHGLQSFMFEIIQSDEFKAWHDDLRDKIARARVSARIRLAEQGNLGDWKPLREGISEMRIDVGPGYRLYFIPLTCGGAELKVRPGPDVSPSIFGRG